MLALVLFVGLLVGGAAVVDIAGRHVEGDDVKAAMAPLKTMEPGSPVLVGNSVAKSSINVEDLQRELNLPNMVDATLHGSGPTTWFVLYTHLLAADGNAPRVMVLVTSMGWVTRSRPVADRDFALEIARSNDPALAELLGLDTEALAWERRFAARLRVRDALVKLLAEPLAMSAVGPDAPREGLGPIDRAVQFTLGRTAGGNFMRNASVGTDAAARHVEVSAEVEPALVALLNATEANHTRVVMVLLPQRESAADLTVDDVGRVLPRNVQVVDFTTVPFQQADYRDNQHFAPEMHDALSRAIAANVSVAMLQRNQRYFPVTERPEPDQR